MDPVTVIGGTGFLGRAVVRRMAESGRCVRVAARRVDALTAPDERVEVRGADVRDDHALATACEGATAVVNAVSLYAESRHGPTFEQIHVDGARRVARAANEAGAERLIHVSGVGADPASPSRYIRSRGRGEAAVREAFPTATIVRPTVLFGPGDAFLSTLDWVTLMPVVPLFGTGATRLQPVHVDDVAAAVVHMLDRPETAGRVFELGGATVYRYREIVRMVLSHRHRHRPLAPVPFPAWNLMARAGSVLPNPPLTPDQVALMRFDNVASRNEGTFDDLIIQPRDLRHWLHDALPESG